MLISYVGMWNVWVVSHKRWTQVSTTPRSNFGMWSEKILNRGSPRVVGALGKLYEILAFRLSYYNSYHT